MEFSQQKNESLIEMNMLWPTDKIHPLFLKYINTDSVMLPDIYIVHKEINLLNS